MRLFDGRIQDIEEYREDMEEDEDLQGRSVFQNNQNEVEDGDLQQSEINAAFKSRQHLGQVINSYETPKVISNLKYISTCHMLIMLVISFVDFFFTTAQLGRLAPALIALGVLRWRLRRTPAAPLPAPDGERLFVYLLGTGPLLLTLCLGLGGMHLASSWATTFFVLAGLLLLRWVPALPPLSVQPWLESHSEEMSAPALARVTARFDPVGPTITEEALGRLSAAVPKQPPGLPTEFLVVLDTVGEARHLWLLRSCGVPALDVAAQLAIQRSRFGTSAGGYRGVLRIIWGPGEGAK